MVNEVATQYDSRSRTFSFAARRWLILPIALGIVGFGAGLGAGVMARPSAEALVRVNSASTDPDAVERAVTSAALELDSVQVYQTAAKKLGVATEELRLRSKIIAVTSSQLVSITVTSKTTGQAVREADGLAAASTEVSQSRLQAELESITNQTRSLIRAQELSNTAAERARVARLGDALAGNQSNLVAGPSQVTIFEQAVPSRGLPPAPLLAALGLVGGGLLGLALALLLGVRRGTVHSARDLRELYPHAAVIETEDLDTMLNLESGSASTVFVAGVEKDVEEFRAVTDAVRDRLLATGREVRVLLNAAAVKQEPFNEHINLVPTTLNDTVLRRIARDRHTLLIVLVELNHTRLAWLNSFAPVFGDRTYLLVNHRAPQWD